MFPTYPRLYVLDMACGMLFSEPSQVPHCYGLRDPSERLFSFSPTLTLPLVKLGMVRSLEGLLCGHCVYQSRVPGT